MDKLRKTIRNLRTEREEQRRKKEIKKTTGSKINK
jgi:hypothetical protein